MPGEEEWSDGGNALRGASTGALSPTSQIPPRQGEQLPAGQVTNFGERPAEQVRPGGQPCLVTREVVSGLVESIEGGRNLSGALAEYPEVFSKVFVSLVRSGEQTGKLPEVLRSLSESLKWEDELISQTRRLLMYPALTLVVVLGVLMALLVFLVPQIAQLFKTMGMALPLQTRALLAVSGFVEQYWLLVLTVPVVAVQAYGYAQLVMERSDPACHLTWTTLAAIGQTESKHGQAGGQPRQTDGRSLHGSFLTGRQGRLLIPRDDGGGNRTLNSMADSWRLPPPSAPCQGLPLAAWRRRKGTGPLF